MWQGFYSTNSTCNQPVERAIYFLLAKRISALHFTSRASSSHSPQSFYLPPILSLYFIRLDFLPRMERTPSADIFHAISQFRRLLLCFSWSRLWAVSVRFVLNELDVTPCICKGLRISVFVLEYVLASLGLVAVEWAVVGAIGAPYGDRIDWNVDDCHYICIAPKAGFCCCEGFYSSRGRVQRGQTSGRPGLQQQYNAVVGYQRSLSA